MAADFPVQMLCKFLGVSRSGFYAWRDRAPGKRAQEDQQLLAELKRSHQQSRGTYGSPRLCAALRQQGWKVGENRVARLMREHGIVGLQKRRFRSKPAPSGPLRAPNRLAQQGLPNRPDQAWVADITYLPTRSGWVYLAAVMDLFSRKIVGWSLKERMDSSLVKEALAKAWQVRRPQPDLLHHSDKGSQYTSSAFGALLLNLNILPSLTGSQHCYENAHMESFWSKLKAELEIHRCPFGSPAQAELEVFDYIETFYNTQRLHSGLGFKSPDQFEQEHLYEIQTKRN
jgi:putative transposase